MALGAFLVDFGGVFGTLDPRKLVSRVSEVLISKKSCFSCLGGLVVDNVTFWDAFGNNVGNQLGARIGSKIIQKIGARLN